MRSFQYRLLTKAIVTNKQLFIYKIKSTNRCYYCDIEVETLKHLFYDCIVIQRFWNQISRWIQQSNKLSWKTILLNEGEDNPRHVNNLIILAAKHYIYVNKCKGKNLSFQAFKQHVSYIRQIESINARINNSSQLHQRKWENVSEDTSDKELH